MAGGREGGGSVSISKIKKETPESFQTKKEKKGLHAIFQKDPLTYENKTLSVLDSKEGAREQPMFKTAFVLT